MLQHMFRYSEGNIKYLVSVEQISGLFLEPDEVYEQESIFHFFDKNP